MKQKNNDYIKLPENLWDVYRSASNNLFHLDGRDLTAEETIQLASAAIEADIEYPEQTFCLYPED